MTGGSCALTGATFGAWSAFRASSSLPAVSKSETLEWAASPDAGSGGGTIEGNLSDMDGNGPGADDGIGTEAGADPCVDGRDGAVGCAWADV